jgi:hypothetical protein
MRIGKRKILEQRSGTRQKCFLNDGTSCAITGIELLLADELWLLLVPCVLIAVITLHAVVAVAIRSWCRIPILPLFNIAARREAYRALSPAVYVLAFGVVVEGWGCFAGIALWEYLRWHYWGMSIVKLSPFNLIFGLFLWSLTGIWSGFSTRRRLSD